MKHERIALRLYRELEDKTEHELAIVTVSAAAVKVAAVSQYVDLRSPNGDTFATLTFPSWVKIKKWEG